jgi:RNA polymerase sigma factor (sigma-70 family)
VTAVLERAAAGDLEARDQLLASVARFVKGRVNRFRGHGVPFEDLLQEVTAVLLERLHRWDPARGSLTTFVGVVVDRECQKIIEREAKHRGQPRAWRRAEAARWSYYTAHGKMPSIDELSALTGISTARLERGWPSVGPLEVQDEKTGEPVPMAVEDPAPWPDEVAEDADLRGALQCALSELPPSERELLRQRFALGMTQEDIATTEGISRSVVGRREGAVLARLRARLA